jgi:hypothetical protein
MGGYVTAKCLWNPNCAADRVRTEFLEAYYGKAADSIQKYIDMLHNLVEKKNIHVMLSADWNSPHLSNALLQQANTIWQKAESVVADDAILLRRVQTARLSVDYAIFECARMQVKNKLPDHQTVLALAKARFQPFSDALTKSNLTQLGEGQSLNKEAYLNGLINDLQLNPRELTQPKGVQ